jgi:hypothetical protein
MTALRQLRSYWWQLQKEAQSLTFEDLTLQSTFRQARALRAFFRQTFSVPEAATAIQQAMDLRETNFLELARTHIYTQPASPYSRLLKNAGCAFSDLQTLVRQQGVEGALASLAREGMCLSAAEFKGKTDVVRGNLRFRVSRADFARRDRAPGLSVQSSGTSNRPQQGQVALDWLAIWSFAKGVFLSAHDLLSSSHAVYDAILPAPAAIYSLLHNARMGLATRRWFAQRMPYNNWIVDAETLWSTHLIVLMGQWFGPGFPKPEFLPLREFGPLLTWVEQERRRGQRCCVDVTASNAVRIAHQAREKGISLEGTTFILHGEPYTEAKRAVIERAGARATTRYSFSLGMNVGHGCAHPLHLDEIHVNQYMLAVISHPRPLGLEGPPVHPLLFTTLYPQAALLHLNVENGDYATLERRACGCALEHAGLGLHLHRIRSYEKFTAEGWTYPYWSIYELMETTLPAEFGGGPGDYQLVEEEDSEGLTRLSLLVDPSVGDVDEVKLRRRLEEAFLRNPSGNWSVAEAWKGTGTFRIRRVVPQASPRGKILPLQILR